MNFLVGLLIVAGGCAIIYWSLPLVDMFGPIQRADKNLGGTRNMFILFGFGLVVLGCLFMFGVVDINEVSSDTYEAGIGPGI